MSLGGWEDGFTDGQPRPAPIHTDQMSGVELYVHPWNNIWEWGGGSNAYEYANAGYKGALWSETVRTSGNMDFMIFPRLLALAERSWYKAEFESIPQNEELFEDEWNAFANAVGSREFRRLDEMDIAFRIPPPGGRQVVIALRDGSVQVTTTYPGLDVELSEDNGRSWQIVQQDLINDSGREVSNPNTAQNMVDYIAEHLAVHLEVISNLIKDPQRYITLKVASKRCHSEYKDKCVLPQWGSGPDSDTSGSGFYTVEDYREMLEYAKARHIEIIPEIDMPGHSAAAMAAMEKREDDIDFMKMHGLQACVWTDIIRTEEQIESMIFPRLLALAERAWHEADWESIKDKTERDSKKQADWEVTSTWSIQSRREDDRSCQW
ncbi:CHB-like protein [Mya arenaria]|uniref:beta-N-acetylhexosaminidase n=1 Tax=Mya arenaria TaxID=6604 RepID=A0ABY7DH55_MYAAR|nr:CHB-like protein [Mya arenaria]